MRRPNKKKYTVIAIIIVSIMVLTPVLSLVISSMAPSNANNGLPVDTAEQERIEEEQEKVRQELIDQIDDEMALKIWDIHENTESYIGDELTLELQYFLTEEYEDKFFVGAIDSINGEDNLFSIYAQTEDGNLPDDLENYDKVKVTGTIDVFQEAHDDHGHDIPVMNVNNIELIEKAKENQDD